MPLKKRETLVAHALFLPLSVSPLKTKKKPKKILHYTCFVLSLSFIRMRLKKIEKRIWKLSRCTLKKIEKRIWNLSRCTLKGIGMRLKKIGFIFGILVFRLLLQQQHSLSYFDLHLRILLLYAMQASSSIAS